jgi:hypothetical protein
MNLELATVTELCDELLKRFEHIMIVGLVSRNDGDLTELRHQKGNSRTCQGLMFGAMLRIERDLDARRYPEEDVSR